MTSSTNLTSTDDNASTNSNSGLLKAACNANPMQMKLTSSSHLSNSSISFFPDNIFSEFHMHMPPNKFDQDLPSALWSQPTDSSLLDAEKHQAFAFNGQMVVEANSSVSNIHVMKTISEFVNSPLAGGCWALPDLDRDLAYSSSLASVIPVSSVPVPSHISSCTQGILEGLLVRGVVGSNAHCKGVSTFASSSLIPSTLPLGLGSEKMIISGRDWSCVTGANNSSIVVDHSKTMTSSHLENFTPDLGFSERAARFSCLVGQGYSEFAPALPPSDPEKVNFRSACRSNSQETVVKNSTGVRTFQCSAPSSPSVGAATEPQDPQLDFDKFPGRLLPLAQTTEASNQMPSAKDSGDMELSLGQQEHFLSPDTGECEIVTPGSTDNSCRKKRKFGCKDKCKDTPAVLQATIISSDKDLKLQNGASLEECKGGMRSNHQVEVEEYMDRMQVDQSSRANSRESAPNSVKGNVKPAEPEKPDYIHVRARRGQATDSHSLAERVRREKISERMKFLQELVPGCSKLTGKAVMLDEIINYVQSLQRQVEFLSMKLATVNPRIDSLHNFKGETMQPRAGTVLFPPHNSAYPVHGSQQMAVWIGPSFGFEHAVGGHPGDASLRRTRNNAVASKESYEDALCQLPQSWSSDLESMVRMGCGEDEEVPGLSGNEHFGECTCAKIGCDPNTPPWRHSF